jgi:hypothetical protein
VGFRIRHSPLLAFSNGGPGALIVKSGHAQRGVYLQRHEPKILEQVRLLYLYFIQSASAKHFISLYHKQGFGGLRSPVLCTAPMFPQYFELIELLS